MMPEPFDLDAVPKQDLSIPLDRAQWYGLLLMIPLGALLVLPYGLRWRFSVFRNAWDQTLDHPFLVIGALVVGVVIHELLHGLSWWYFGHKSRSVITFGFQLKTLTPYAHCTEPMDVNAYRIGAAMPGLVLGVIPWLVSLITGDDLTFAFAFFFTIAALGDAMVLWMIRHVARGSQVIDHPTKAGCYVVLEDKE